MFHSFRFSDHHCALPASVALHAGAFALLLWLGMPRSLPEPPDSSIAVDIFSESAFAALIRPPSAPETPVPANRSLPASSMRAVAPAPPDQAPSGPQAVHATTFFASGILDDPANRDIAETMLLLAGDEQVIQICNMEALEQLRVADASKLPDAVVGYAYGDLVLAGNRLTASGGAFRSAGQWFHLQYHCTAAADARGVSAFDFTVGDAIPESEWEEHALNGSDEGLD
ncbi:MAG: DUF930 domain-containing protein [Candidatus Devosia phytovorans]|uniref:DUF930 domain-containing protein n=1 Tax=Candidatus Devosia phytovorans TaxID=3121372 RepID=A0AAJ6B0G5_9HYPH|nr:DUF930 domain-containing protein [Devosia sp.]WEK04209.1 MAG: DUF930 domain-containing protein [Devosia sp.]